MIEIKYDGTTETSDLESVTVNIKTGAVAAVYRVAEGGESTYRTIAVQGVSTTAFVAAVVTAAKTKIDTTITKVAAEPIEELP